MLKILLALLALVLASPAQEERILPFRPQVDRLDNGLTLITVPTGAKGIIAYYTVVRTGARDEVDPGRSGFAHFFEHMMFRGTEKYSSAQFGAIMQKHGADTNAYTTEDYTAYHAVAPVTALDDIIDLESDRFQRLKYTEADFRTEAGAVLGEYNKAISSPDLKLWEVLSETGFDVHPYGHTVIGYEDDIKQMPTGFEYSLEFFRRHYTPDNTTIIVAGDVSRDALLPKIQAAYGGWTGKHDPKPVPAEPEPKQARTKHVDWAAPTPPLLAVAWRVPGLAGDEKATAALAVAVDLMVGETSALHRELVLEQQKVISLEHSAGWHRRDPNLLLIEIKHKQVADRQALVEKVQAAAAALAAGQVDAARLASVKSHTRYARLMSLESPDQVAGYLARFVGITGDPEAAERFLGHIGAVTAEDVAAVAGRYLVPDRRVVVSLAQGGAKEARR